MAIGFPPMPPWLMTRPYEHAEASSAGLREGLAAANIWARANEERARLEQSARRADMEAALESERLQQKSVYEAQKLAADAAYNKAALGQAQARIEQTQANAARAAQQWSAQNQLAQAREARMGQQWQGQNELARGRETRLGGDAATRIAIAQQRATEAERHNREMEAKQKGEAEDPEMAAYAKRARERMEHPEPGLLSRAVGGIKGLFSGGPAVAPTAPKSPYAEGSYIRNKKDGKLYMIRNGMPVLVDDSGEEPKAEPTEETSD